MIIVSFEYLNWKGSVNTRFIIPIEVYLGKTEYYKDDQILLKAYDLDREEIRTFAVKNIIGRIKFQSYIDN